MPTNTGVAGFTHAALRVGAGLLFMAHGAQKLFGWFGGFAGQPGATAPLMSQMGLAGGLELLGGGLLVLGLLTRPTALVLAAEMLVAYFMVHFPKGLWPIQNQGEPAALYFLIFLYLMGNGSGPYSVDAALRRRKRDVAGEVVREEEGEAVEVTREYRVPGMERPTVRPRTREREHKQGD